MKTLCAIAIVSSAVLLGGQGRPQVMIEWASAGSEQSQTKYSVAAEITRQMSASWHSRGNGAQMNGRYRMGRSPEIFRVRPS